MFHRGLCVREGFLATEHTQKLPEDLRAYFQPVASYVQIFRRREAAENVLGHGDGLSWSGIGTGQEPESLGAL